MQVVEGTLDHYSTMIDYIMNNDLNNAAIYNEIQQRMNVDSFIDHIIMTIYCANTSWGHNREWWRPREENGKWQWLIVDLDRGFNINNSNTNLVDNLKDDYELFQYLLSSPFFVDRFCAMYPDVHLVIEERTTESSVAALQEGLIDAAILATPLLEKDINERVLY